MRETTLRLNSSYLENERSVWICEPEGVSGANDLVVFLDGERCRERVDALSVIEELRGQVANSWFVFVSEGSPEARWHECPWYRRMETKIPVEFYLDVGTQEIRENVRDREDVVQVVSQVEGVRRFRNALLARRYAVRYQEFDGGHDYACWNRTLVDARKWAASLQAAE